MTQAHPGVLSLLEHRSLVRLRLVRDRVLGMILPVSGVADRGIRLERVNILGQLLEVQLMKG